MYADDAAIFLKPTVPDVTNLKSILLNFGLVTGLQTNLQKTSVTPISCDGINISSILADLPVSQAVFPIKYLGLPLTPRRLKKIDFQPLVDKATGKLSTWNGRNLTQAGRVCLVKSVLSSQPVYLMTVIKPPVEVLQELDKIRRHFLWAGDKALSGGKCKVNWAKTTLPKDLGGLGVLHLGSFARALRLRWLWQEWTSPEKAWIGTGVPCDEGDKTLFASCTSITIGDGSRASFWHSGWLQGSRPKDIAPLLFAKSRKKRRNVASAIHENTWVRDLQHLTGLTPAHLLEFVTLWNLVDQSRLQPQQEDKITWTLTPKGEYTTSSAYRAQFRGYATNPALAAIWKTWAPPKCKFFAWLILQDRVWTSDRLARRHWDHSPVCPLCRTTAETAVHLLAQCRYTLRIWSLLATWIGPHFPPPTRWLHSASPNDWWLQITTVPDTPRKGLRSLTLLVSREIWKERNNRIFDRRGASVPSFVNRIRDEVSLWIAAGVKDLAGLLARE
jgi:hypothetical protein